MFGERLSYLRRINHVTQKQLGFILNYSKNAISSWESGRTEPPIRVVVEIAEYFNVSADYLLGLNQNDKDNIKYLKKALKEAGMLNSENKDMTMEDFEKAIKIVNILKDTKK